MSKIAKLNTKPVLVEGSGKGKRRHYEWRLSVSVGGKKFAGTYRSQSDVKKEVVKQVQGFLAEGYAVDALFLDATGAGFHAIYHIDGSMTEKAVTSPKRVLGPRCSPLPRTTVAKKARIAAGRPAKKQAKANKKAPAKVKLSKAAKRKVSKVEWKPSMSVRKLRAIARKKKIQIADGESKANILRLLAGEAPKKRGRPAKVGKKPTTGKPKVGKKPKTSKPKVGKKPKKPAATKPRKKPSTPRKPRATIAKVPSAHDVAVAAAAAAPVPAGAKFGPVLKKYIKATGDGRDEVAILAYVQQVGSSPNGRAKIDALKQQVEKPEYALAPSQRAKFLRAYDAVSATLPAPGAAAPKEAPVRSRPARPATARPSVRQPSASRPQPTLVPPESTAQAPDTAADQAAMADILGAIANL